MSITPKNRPQQSRTETLGILSLHGIAVIDCVALLGIRGYYKDSMGKPDVNDINLYDDALFIVSPNIHLPCNFNTDPAKAGAKKAMLDTGIYDFYKGKHKGKYNALRPFPEGIQLPCTRDGKKSMCGATNIHKGGINNTFSEGCQTIPPDQYDKAMSTIYSEMAKYGQKTVKYILIAN